MVEMFASRTQVSGRLSSRLFLVWTGWNSWKVKSVVLYAVFIVNPEIVTPAHTTGATLTEKLNRANTLESVKLLIAEAVRASFATKIEEGTLIWLIRNPVLSIPR